MMNNSKPLACFQVKPEISRQLTQLVTRVMNDAFSELPADKLLNNLNRSARSGQSLVGPLAPVITFPLQHNVERRGQANRVNISHIFKKEFLNIKFP